MSCPALLLRSFVIVYQYRSILYVLWVVNQGFCRGANQADYHNIIVLYLIYVKCC